MNKTLKLQYLATITFVTLLLSACNQQPAPTALAVTSLPQTPPTDTPPTETPLTDLEKWDMVWISDSSGWGVAERYAEWIEKDMGVEVEVHIDWIGGLSAVEVLEALTKDQSSNPSMRMQHWPDLIREAEVIVFYANPEGSDSEDHPQDWQCVPGAPFQVTDCSPEAFEAYVANLSAIYDEFFQLREGKPTIIRAFDAYNPLYSVYQEKGIYEECRACWLNYNAAIHQAAEAYGVPLAGVFEAFNGPDRDEYPRQKDYIRDGEHPSELGQQVIADALRELGYEPIIP